MAQHIKLQVILLAAGKSSRFGSNKLLTPLMGKKILSYTLEKLSPLVKHHLVVVTNKVIHKGWEDLANVSVVVNEYLEKGISHSIRLGIEQGDTCDAYLFVVADQPLLTKETLEKMIEAYTEAPDRILIAGWGETLGNPVIFPSIYKEALLGLEGDRGGKYLIQKKKLPYTIYQVDACEELWDIDTQEDYEKIVRRLNHGIIKT